MKLTKMIALLLVAVMLAIPMASCSEGTDTTTGTKVTAEGTTDLWTESNLPTDLNFEGEQIRILARADDEFYDELQIDPDEVMNIIDESVLNRENWVEERIGIELKVTKETSRGSLSAITTKVRQNFESGVDLYDLVAGSCYHLMPLTMESILYDFNEVDYVELDQPWYSQNFIELSAINDYNLYITGDAALSLMRMAFVTFVNMELAARFNCADIYQTVLDKKWTIDYQSRLVAGVYENLNSNSTVDEEDLFGFTISNGAGTDLYWSAFDMSILSKNSDGDLEITLDSDKVGSALVKCCDLLWNNPGVFVQPHDSDYEYDRIRQNFASGNRLFANIHLYSVEGQSFIDMEQVYGIIPNPMWDEDQADYYSYVHDQYSVFGIPGTVTDEKLPAVGAFIEATSNYSYNETRDVYYEVALKGRYARDEQSRVMLDQIINSIKIDAGWIYSGCLKDFANKWRDLLKVNNPNWSGQYRALKPVLEHSMRQLNQKYGPVQ